MIDFTEFFGADINNTKFPKDRRMKIIEDNNIIGMSSENIRFLINELVKKYAKTYLEVGTYQGCSLISAALYNPHVRCIGIDNFSKFNKNKHGKWTCSSSDVIQKNIEKMDLSNVEFIQGDYKTELLKLFEKEKELKIDVYLYDGLHDYQSQIDGLNIIKPYLSESCIILVDDLEFSGVKKANIEWFEKKQRF